ncbi:MAG: family 16 glycosylhydrolase [Saprospiraceae bacterium]|nr:family 16 glycosylhydrolase [Saprospiraceae bacterium]
MANAQCPSFSTWDNWEVEYLDGGKLICSDQGDYELEDEFTENELNASTLVHGVSVSNFWREYFNNSACGTHTTCEDQIFRQGEEYVRVQDGYLVLTARHEPGSVCGNDVRDYTSGMIHGNEQVTSFNYGRYSINCNFPTSIKPEIMGKPVPMWYSFWMWHHEEIDVFENFGNEEAYLANSHGSNGSCIGTVNQNMLGFHTYEVEWTPFKTIFYFDGNPVNIVYKYYDMNQNVVDVNCGDDIPQGYFKINPGYIHTIQNGEPRHFLPIISLGVLPDCFDCGNNNPSENPCSSNGRIGVDYPTLLPAEWKTDWVRINEITYEQVRIKNNFCSDLLCPGEEYCFTVSSSILNGTHLGPGASYTPGSWSFSPNVTVQPAHKADTRCVIYNSPYQGQPKIDIFVSIPAGPGYPAFTLSKTVQSPATPPEIEWHSGCPQRFFIRTNGRCPDDLQISVTHNGQSIPYTIVNQSDRFIELTVAGQEGDVAVVYKTGCNGQSSSVIKHFGAPFSGTYTNSEGTFVLNSINTYSSPSGFVLINLNLPPGATNLTGAITSGQGSLVLSGYNQFSLVFPRNTSVTLQLCYTFCEQNYCFNYTFTNNWKGGEWKLAPNPANDQIRVIANRDQHPEEQKTTERSSESLENNVPQILISLLDVDSKTLVQRAVQAGFYDISLDISHLKPGNYFIKIEDPQSKEEQTIPFVKTGN